MKKIILMLLWAVAATTSFTQNIPTQSIEDSVLGWMKVYNFKGVKEGVKVDDKIYSAAQISICDSFANWIQASYIPKGGLGDVKKAVSAKLSLYTQDDAALPQTYGAYSKTYFELKYNSNHKMEPLTNSHEQWSITANGVIGIAAIGINTPSQYYFTLPSFEEQGYSKELPLLYELGTHPNTKKYFTYFRRNSAIGNEKTVLLCKNNQLPFIKITKGEWLQVMEAAVARAYEKEKKKIIDDYKSYPNPQKQIDNFMRYLNEKNEKRLTCLKNNKEKYKNRLQETASIFTDQPGVLLENYADIFEGNGGSSISLPVYKIDPVLAAKCKTDQPQWIRITWHGDINNPVGKHQHESIINNFNFEYVYNFFFDPAKVKGQPYRPLHNPSQKEVIVEKTASRESVQNAADKNVFYYEDFSTIPADKTPASWKSNLNYYGKKSSIKMLDDEKGSWLELRGNTITANNIPKPLPQNFTLSYDVAVPQNFTWGGKSLELILSKQKADQSNDAAISFFMRPSFDSRDGYARIETTLPEGYIKNGAFDAPGFGNNKKINRVSVSIKKSGGDLVIEINGKKVASYPNGVPPGLQFNYISFKHISSNEETEKYFISNIKITKE